MAALVFSIDLDLCFQLGSNSHPKPQKTLSLEMRSSQT